MQHQNKIIVVDETIREGMQHRGIVFSYPQRLKILEFQEKLNIDVCQAGYVPAHETEAEYVRELDLFCKKNKFRLAVAGMGRALLKDVKLLVDTDINHFHLHFHIKEESPNKNIVDTISESIDYIRSNTHISVISIAMLDVGKTSDLFIKKIIDFLSFGLEIDIISLPDTSGIMAPNSLFDKIKYARKTIEDSASDLGIHCHNDLGFANANTIMGILAGGSILEVSALGIGERNGIADLFITADTLKKQGFDLNVNTSDIETFKEYYSFINSIYETQTGQSLLNYNTPLFGNGVKSHVAGTHAVSSFGIHSKEEYFINVLCGTHLIEKYLLKEKIAYNKSSLIKITNKIKSESARLNRRVYKKEILEIAERYQ